MKHRTGAALLAAALALPVAAHAQKTLNAVLEAEVVTLDPHVTTAYITRTFDYMVFDTLFAEDSQYKVHPQMVDTWKVSDDKLTWTFTLRDGLKWADGGPVTAADCVASLTRWEPHDTLGRLLQAATASMTADSAKTFTIHLKQPYPLMLDTLGKPSSIVPFMIPAKLASVPVGKLTDMDGSGPFLFRKDLWVPGSTMVLDRNPNYVPRSEPADFLSGGKKVEIDRLVLKVIRDTATQVSALQAGEIDYLQYAPYDFLPVLKQNPHLTIMGFKGLQMFQGNYRVNAASGPFADPAVRRVLWKLVDQHVTQAAIGIPDSDYVADCKSFWMCDTPLSTTAGSSAAQFSVADAKAELAKTNYHGEPVVILTVSDNNVTNTASQVLAANLQKAGFTVNNENMDWGTVLQRRAVKTGWSVFPVYSSGFDMASPLTHFYVANNCADYPGWSCDPRVTKLLASFAQATTPDDRKSIAAQIQEIEYETVPSVMWGQFTEPAAYNKKLVNLVQSSIPVFWGVDIK